MLKYFNYIATIYKYKYFPPNCDTNDCKGLSMD